MTQHPAGEDWAAVRDAVEDRMSELRTTVPRLPQETGLSQTTICYIGRPNGGRTTSSVLVALSAALRWRNDHLRNILDGHRAATPPAPEARTARETKRRNRKLKTTVHNVELLADELRSR